MTPIENYKDVEINGRKFRIKKFNAMTGAYMALKLTGILAPFFNQLDFDKLKDIKNPSDLTTGSLLGSLNISGIMSALGSISEEDFNYVQEKCLKVSSEVLPSGITPVLSDNGAFGVIGLEEDTATVLALIVHTLIFNVKGFFSGSPLASLLGGLSITPQQS